MPVSRPPRSRDPSPAAEGARDLQESLCGAPGAEGRRAQRHQARRGAVLRAGPAQAGGGGPRGPQIAAVGAGRGNEGAPASPATR